MSHVAYAGATDQTVDVWIPDSTSTTGAGKTGLVYNSSGLVCYYRKGATGSATAVSLATQTVGGAHSDGGFVEVSSSNMPGLYRLDLPDAVFDTEGVVKIMIHGATGAAPVVKEVSVLPSKTTTQNAIADAVLSRSVSNVEGSAAEHSVCTLVLGATEMSISGTTLTIKRTDGTTTHYTKNLTTNSAAEPITSVS